MELALSIISIVELIVVLCFLVALIWGAKSKGSMTSIVTRMVLATILFVLQIPQLVLEVSLDKTYANTIFLLIVWAINVFWSAFYMGTEMGFAESLTIKIIACNSRNEDNDEGEWIESEQRD